MHRINAITFLLALVSAFQGVTYAQDLKGENTNRIKFIESDKYSFKVAVPEGLKEKFPIKEISSLQRVIGGYANAEGDSVYVAESTKSPYEEMSEKEFFDLNLKGVNRVGEIDSSGPITIDHKTAYCLTAKITAANPNIYTGTCTLRIRDRAIVIYVTYGNKDSFVESWKYVIDNSKF